MFLSVPEMEPSFAVNTYISNFFTYHISPSIYACLHFYRNPVIQMDVKSNVQRLDHSGDKMDKQIRNTSTWEPYDNSNQFYLYISSKDLVLMQGFRETETYLWNTLVPRLLQSPWQPHNHGHMGYNPILVWVLVGLFSMTIVSLCMVGVKYLALHKKMETLKKHFHPTTAV